MDPLIPGFPPQPPAPPTGTDGFPTTSSGAEDFMDRTVVMKVPGTGMTIFNRYKLQRVLGRGGMGVVWLADDLKLERPVALKFLPSLIGLDPAAVKELKTETRRGLELSHPNIVRIYDFVDDDDAAAISMEFVDGRTLSELRLNTEGGVFTTEEVSQWLLGVCDALDYAHFQRKLVHRDLKPANIMLTSRDAVAKIADFGIARSLSDTMSRLSVANMGASGTLPYMSPQQAMGERPLPTDDVYSLGATLYELFSGKPPFYRGDLPMQINSKIPPSVAERRLELEIKAREELPRHWEEAIAACLSKDPNMRPTCAGMLAEMLGLKIGTGTSRTVPAFGTTQRSSSGSAGAAKGMNPRIIAAAAAAVVVVGTGAVMVLRKEAPKPSVPQVAEKPPVARPAEPPAKPKAAEPAPKKQTEVAKVEPKPAPAPVEPPKTTPAPTAPAAVSTAPAPAPAASPAVAAAPVTMPGSVNPTAPAPVAQSAPPPVPAPAPAAMTTPLPAVQAMAPAAAPVVAAAPIIAAMPAPAVVAAVPSPAPVPPVPPVPLPPGVVLTPDLISQMQTQPLVADPPTGFWTVEQMFPTPPFASYTPTGKRYLLFRAQTLLKEKGLYTSTVDGKEGKGTHNAIQLFQARSGLRPTGLLDVPTLAALQLSAEQDNLAWVPPGGASYSPGSSSSGGVPAPGSSRRIPVGSRYSPQIEEPGFLKRKLRGFTKDDEE